MENKKSGRNSIDKGPVIRTTVVLPKVLDQNIEMFCSIEGRPKGEVIASALKQFLERNGLQPDKSPKSVTVIY